MTNLTSALRIATSGLNLAQVGLGTVSHNVVNSNTAGYSRQTVQANAVSSNGFGNGVQLSSIQRVSDRFLDVRANAAVSDLEYADTKKSYLDSLEGVVTNASADGGLDTIAGDMFSSISALSNDPSNSSLKRGMVQKLDLFSRTINSIHADLSVAASDADNAINSELTTVNGLLRDISDLNAQISATARSSDGANSNDLRDARDSKIVELSKRFKLQINENGGDGSVRITLENGRRLVDDAGYTQFKRTSSGGAFQNIGLQAVLQDGSLSSTVLPIDPNSLTSGKIKAIIDVRDSVVANLQAQMDEYANTTRSAINQVSSAGTSFPPQRTLTSGNTNVLANASVDLLATAPFSSMASQTFDISVTNSLGQPVLTTVGSTPITIPGAGPFSLTNLATLINSNATIGNGTLGGTAGVTATALTDANGKPYLQIQAANASYKVVLSNKTGDVLGTLGMNNILTGTGASDIAVSSTIATNPDLIPTARMRSTDGGVSSLDNQNIIALAALADTKLSYSAAGGLGTQSSTVSDYAGQITSNLSVVINDAKDRQTFADNISTQLDTLKSSVSGVNVNEELSQMLVYQNSFQASARLVSVVNDLLAELVNIVR